MASIRASRSSLSLPCSVIEFSTVDLRSSRLRKEDACSGVSWSELHQGFLWSPCDSGRGRGRWRRHRATGRWNGRRLREDLEFEQYARPDAGGEGMFRPYLWPSAAGWTRERRTREGGVWRDPWDRADGWPFTAGRTDRRPQIGSPAVRRSPAKVWTITGNFMQRL